MSFAPLSVSGLNFRVIVGKQLLQSASIFFAGLHVGALGLGDVTGHETDHNDTSIFGGELENVIGNISRMMADGSGGGVRKNDRGFGDPERGTHGVVGDVG